MPTFTILQATPKKHPGVKPLWGQELPDSDAAKEWLAEKKADYPAIAEDLVLIRQPY